MPKKMPTHNLNHARKITATGKDGRYKKSAQWSRQYNRDLPLELVPKQVGGAHKTFDRFAKNVQWTKQKCFECSGDVWVSANAVHKFGHKWRCRKCKAAGRHEAVLAALAVAERKKKMGIKW